MKLSYSVYLIWRIAAEEAYYKHFTEIEPEHFLLAILKFPGLKNNEFKKYDCGDFNIHKAEMQSVMEYIEENSIKQDEIVNILDELDGNNPINEEKLIHRSEACKTIFKEVETYAKLKGYKKIEIIHFLEFLFNSRPTKILQDVFKKYQPKNNTQQMIDLPDNLHLLENKLLEKIFGQDEAVKNFTKGLFNSDMYSSFYPDQKTPRSVFVFAGPPGVGKTVLAKSCAEILGRRFKKFDMSEYAEHHHHEALIGLAKGYKDAGSGILTKFVNENPNSVLIFDEIEKAHINTIHLFLQILDSGELEDKYDNDLEVNFRNAIIIFTTNAGKSLYENSKISILNKFHTKTVISALENEIDPRTGNPFFPRAICSRLSTGYIILFNHLKVAELYKIAKFHLDSIVNRFESQYKIEIVYDKNKFPYLLLLKEGAIPDARIIVSQVEKFFSNEILKLKSYFETGNSKKQLSDYEKIIFTIDDDFNNFEAVKGSPKLFCIPKKISVLLICEEQKFEKIKRLISNSEIDLLYANNSETIISILDKDHFDMVLVDPWIYGTDDNITETIFVGTKPSTSRKFDAGKEILQSIRKKRHGSAVYLVKFMNSKEDFSYPDKELIYEFISSKNAEGIIKCDYERLNNKEWKQEIVQFKKEIFNEFERIYWERIVEMLRREHSVINFETTPDDNELSNIINIKIRNPKLAMAIMATDLGEILNDLERPKITFSDVFGADSAKRELQFFIEYIKNPRKFRSGNLKPPKGIILYGPPGTGKTLLAKAFAGETQLAFLNVSATSFVTEYQGSGPKNVRELFNRARKYAPAVIFIDEIDAIGKTRSGSLHQQSVENTLNALLTEMDGFNDLSDERPIFVMAATNFNLNVRSSASGSVIDPALIRRFSKTIFIDLPDKEGRERYLKTRLENRNRSEVTSAAIGNIAERSSGMSFAELESIIEAAERESMINNSTLNNEYLEQAFDDRFGEVAFKDKVYIEKTAYHEAGHTLMYWLTGNLASYVTVISRNQYGGYMAFGSSDIEQPNLTKKQLIDRINVALGGRVAEQIFFGEEGLTTGASEDLNYATKIVLKMITQFGMYEELGLLAESELAKLNLSENEYYSNITNLANQILKEQHRKTTTVLTENKTLLDKLAQELVKKEKLTKEQLEVFFTKNK